MPPIPRRSAERCRARRKRSGSNSSSSTRAAMLISRPRLQRSSKAGLARCSSAPGRSCSPIGNGSARWRRERAPVHRAVLLGLIGSILGLGGGPEGGTSDSADEVTLSLKGAKSPTRDRKPRSTGTKARAHVSDGPNSLIELKKQLEARTRELAEAQGHFSEALERQAATDEVLRVISSSPGDLKPVFEIMLANAVRLCQAKFGNLFLREGDAFRLVAMHGAPTAHAESYQREPLIDLREHPHAPLACMAETKAVVHIADLTADQAYIKGDSRILALVKSAGAQTLLNVPMLKEGELIGAIAIYRQEVRPFTDKQVALVTNFAAQAVIAIENTRLLNELRERTDDLSESLEQQTATSEVLQVISSSPGALEPVFQAMLENATRICDAKFGFMWRIEGGSARIISKLGIPQAMAEYLQPGPHRPALNKLDPLTAISRVIQSRQTLHITDYRADPSYIARDPLTVAAIELGGARTLLGVPMLKDRELIGAIGIYRQEVHPFTDKQIELVQNFAAQAVIAIENTRLLNELRESLQQQTATADVLKVISRSAFDLQTVLERLLETAARLCGAPHGQIFRYDGESCRAVAGYNVPLAFVEMWQRTPVRAGRETTTGRALLERRPVQIIDVRADPEYEMHESISEVSWGSVLAVPLLREGVPLGVIALWRGEVEPFSDRQIELATSFADQAVIAIENVRLFDEVQARTREVSEALEHQTATSEVLNVITRSPTNAQPVFDAIVQSAARLCEATFSVVWLYDGDLLHVAATNNFTPEVLGRLARTYPRRPDRSVLAGRAVLDGDIAHVHDLLADPEYSHELALAGNWRASLAV